MAQVVKQATAAYFESFRANHYLTMGECVVCQMLFCVEYRFSRFNIVQFIEENIEQTITQTYFRLVLLSRCSGFYILCFRFGQYYLYRIANRSEERRVGKEWRSWWVPEPLKRERVV